MTADTPATGGDQLRLLPCSSPRPRRHAGLAMCSLVPYYALSSRVARDARRLTAFYSFAPLPPRRSGRVADRYGAAGAARGMWRRPWPSRSWLADSIWLLFFIALSGPSRATCGVRRTRGYAARSTAPGTGCLSSATRPAQIGPVSARPPPLGSGRRGADASASVCST